MAWYAKEKLCLIRVQISWKRAPVKLVPLSDTGHLGALYKQITLFWNFLAIVLALVSGVGQAIISGCIDLQYIQYAYCHAVRRPAVSMIRVWKGPGSNRISLHEGGLMVLWLLLALFVS